MDLAVSLQVKTVLHYIYWMSQVHSDAMQMVIGRQFYTYLHSQSQIALESVVSHSQVIREWVVSHSDIIRKSIVKLLYPAYLIWQKPPSAKNFKSDLR